MTAEMPKKYWRNLPEAELIPELISQAMPRNLAMQAAPATSIRPGAARVTARLAAARKEVPMSDDDPKSLTEARKSVEACRRCDLYACATRAVFGEGPGDATLMLVGEQPGDKEDLAGKPFVGPAGRLMNQIAEEAGLDRSACYVTNAVKHFKNEPRGKRRIHKKPDAGEVRACKWWLDKELSFVKPKLAVAMGATAALSLTGDGTGIMKRRGHIEKRDDGLKVLITVHPSSILRIRDDAAKEAQRKAFRNDLARAWSEAGKAA